MADAKGTMIISQKVRNIMLRKMGITRASFKGLTDGQKKRYFWWALILRPFTAPSLRMFWNYWNPLYGYYLGRHIFKPLSRFLPDSLSLILTFLFSGFFLHDLFGWPMTVWSKGFFLPPVATWFLLMALGILVTDGLGIKFKGCGWFITGLLHASFLVGTHLLAMQIVSWSRLW